MSGGESERLGFLNIRRNLVTYKALDGRGISSKERRWGYGCKLHVLLLHRDHTGRLRFYRSGLDRFKGLESSVSEESAESVAVASDNEPGDALSGRAGNHTGV
jgi:hypothetical protein